MKILDIVVILCLIHVVISYNRKPIAITKIFQWRSHVEGFQIISTSLVLSITISMNLILGSPVISVANDVDSNKLFTLSCAGCHSGGGNLFQPTKTLKLDSLQVNGYDSIDKIVEITAKGKGMMPAFGEFMSPKGNLIPAKLSEKEMTSLASYILDQAEKNWPENKEVKNCDEYPGC